MLHVIAGRKCFYAKRVFARITRQQRRKLLVLTKITEQVLNGNLSDQENISGKLKVHIMWCGLEITTESDSSVEWTSGLNFIWCEFYFLSLHPEVCCRWYLCFLVFQHDEFADSMPVSEQEFIFIRLCVLREVRYWLNILVFFLTFLKI